MCTHECRFSTREQTDKQTNINDYRAESSELIKIEVNDTTKKRMHFGSDLSQRSHLHKSGYLFICLSVNSLNNIRFMVKIKKWQWIGQGFLFLWSDWGFLIKGEEVREDAAQGRGVWRSNTQR